MRSLKRGFSLIELLVVLVIIGVIYATAASFISQKTGAKEADKWALDRLDSALREAASGYARLVCDGETCDSCRVIDEYGESIAKVPRLFEEPPKAFFFDKTGYLDERKFPADRCFEMERFENGAISETLLEYRGKFYRYYAFMRPAEVFASFDDARKSLDPRNFVPQSSNEYFSELD